MAFSFGNSDNGCLHAAVNAPDDLRKTTGRQFPGTYQLFHPASGRIWWLKEGDNSVGRCRDNDVNLTDDSVSRHHAKIVVEGSHLYVEDLKSSNGTRVAGQRVKSGALMRDVTIAFGRIEVILRKPSLLNTGDFDWSDTRD